MVMAMSLRGCLDTPLNAYGIEASNLWRHSLLAATPAELVVNRGINIEVDSSTAFTVGLLHDIGKLITNRLFTAELIGLDETPGRQRPACY
jgi:HD-like signal output (HDOD) protein